MALKRIVTQILITLLNGEQAVTSLHQSLPKFKFAYYISSQNRSDIANYIFQSDPSSFWGHLE